MGARERAYKQRISRAFSEAEAVETPPVSPEEAFRQFFELMDAVLPVVEKLPRPRPSDDGEPDELGFYRRWHELEARRR